MRIHKILETTYAEGPGCRFCVWVQGCQQHCDGCFATALWAYDGGTVCSVQELCAQLYAVRDTVCGVTLLGGEPFDQAAELAEFAAEAHRLGKTVLTFTGYTYAFLQNGDCAAHHALLDQTDLLIDGKFEQSLTDYSRPLVGSSNQRFLFLTDAIPPQEIAAYKNRFEIRTDAAGRVTVNGMGNIEKLKQYTATIEGVQYG